jgi:hypothetical protein
LNGKKSKGLGFVQKTGCTGFSGGISKNAILYGEEAKSERRGNEEMIKGRLN